MTSRGRRGVVPEAAPRQAGSPGRHHMRKADDSGKSAKLSARRAGTIPWFIIRKGRRVERDIFVFAREDWGTAPERARSLARSLAGAGRRVFYFSHQFIDSPTPGYQIDHPERNTPVFRISLHLKTAGHLEPGRLSDAQRSQAEHGLAALIRDFSALSTISLVLQPDWYQLVRRIPNSYRIFDFSENGEMAGDDKSELTDPVERILADADLVTASTNDLRSFAARYNRQVVLVESNAAGILSAIDDIRMPRVSVIVLSFNNWHLTQACLESVLERSDYPDLEIIVVDNASTDETQIHLRELARKYPLLRTVFNSENIGFAAGNNVGLSLATGDYLVLLNNDTVVTQGWVLTLRRHFQDIPRLGLLGPVTNNIGNEARISTSYTDPDQMPAEALRYTLSRMGQVCRMSNAAFFCVMMPRSTYERCGPISEDYGRGFFEDDDYCRRVEAAGLGIACAEDVFVHHHLSASFSKLNDKIRRVLYERNKEIYERRWGRWIPHFYRS